MRCLRCGYCCIKYCVVVVKPEYIDEDLNFEDLSIREKLMFKDSDIWCPHLEELNKFTFSCKVHDKPWFNKTPCFDFSQIEQSESNCRLGTYVSNCKEVREYLRSLKKEI